MEGCRRAREKWRLNLEPRRSEISRLKTWRRRRRRRRRKNLYHRLSKLSE
jgi:hypothetical protein